jgi:phage tail-like protein
MANKSSYLQYLPPVLWVNDPPPPAFSLSTMLMVFEKLLTGIDDGVIISQGSRSYEAIQDVIARLFRLFDPWTTPPQFLDWLAQWVALQFPATWDEYQRRKITSEIVQIYVRRGLKDGLDDFLDIYGISARKPRVVIDDCDKILFAQPLPTQSASIYTLVSQEPLIAPHCIALGPEGSFFLADEGNNQGLNQVNPAVWRVSSGGQYDYAGPGAHAQPLGPAAFHPTAPVAVAADNASPFGIYILDGGLNFILYYLTSPTFIDPAPQVATSLQLGVAWGIAMATDLNGHPLILDRGAVPGSPSNTKIVDLTMAGAPPTFVSATNHALAQVVEPLSFAVLQNGNLVVGDGRDQTTVAPADLILVDRTNPMTWVTSSLLGAVPAGQNPLIAPTGIVQEDATHLLVVDAGLKPIVPDALTPLNSIVAQQATVYRIDLSQNPPVITRASETRQLVYPRGMVMTTDRMLHICDSGLPDIQGFSTRAWRATPQQFSVVVHFPGPPAVTPQQKQDRNRFLQSIKDVVVDQKPAQSNWLVLSES